MGRDDAGNVRGRVDPRVGRRSGFTLIEVLVVVAIIALLLAVLLPSLAKAREQARRAVCASQLKQFGHGLVMYLNAHRDTLPGPIHGAVELETYLKDASRDYEQWHLGYLMRRYFTDKSMTGDGTDDVAKCPTALRMSRNRLRNTFSRSQANRPFTYSLNNFDTRMSPSSGQVEAFMETSPPAYFGWPNAYWQTSPPPFRELGSAPKWSKPKKILAVRLPASEWAVADAFRYEDVQPIMVGSDRRPGQWQRGTYPWEGATTRGLIPTAPYHDKGINLAMFDGHVEWQRPYRGSVSVADSY